MAPVNPEKRKETPPKAKRTRKKKSKEEKRASATHTRQQKQRKSRGDEEQHERENEQDRNRKARLRQKQKVTMKTMSRASQKRKSGRVKARKSRNSEHLEATNNMSARTNRSAKTWLDFGKNNARDPD